MVWWVYLYVESPRHLICECIWLFVSVPDRFDGWLHQYEAHGIWSGDGHRFIKLRHSSEETRTISIWMYRWTVRSQTEHVQTFNSCFVCVLLVMIVTCLFAPTDTELLERLKRLLNDVTKIYSVLNPVFSHNDCLVNWSLLWNLITKY